MKRVILCPNPYRDTGLSAAKEADAILRSTPHPVSTLIEIQASADGIRPCQCIVCRLHGCRRIPATASDPVKPAGRRRAELPCLIDHCFDTVWISAAPYSIHDYRTYCNLTFIGLVSCFTEDNGRHQFLIL